MQATILLAVCVGLTALMPILEYVFILRKDSNVNIAFAAAIWAGCGMIFLVGVWAYYSMSVMVLGGHAALVCIAGSAMVVTFTEVYYFADMRCTISQATINGCSGCACAVSDQCNAVRTDSSSVWLHLQRMHCAACHVCPAAHNARLACTLPQTLQSYSSAPISTHQKDALCSCVQGNLGSHASDEACKGCTAWGRDTCTSILASTSIASWGGILMAPLLAVVVAMSLLLSQRVASQKQALAQVR